MVSDNKKMRQHWKRNSGTYYFLISIIVFCTAYFIQEHNANSKIESCPIVTVAYPIRMPDSHKLYFFYHYRGKRYEDAASLGSDDLGCCYTIREVLASRFWVQVYCKDLSVSRIYWEAKVPDTLQYIPANGWDKIPYGFE